MFSMLPCDRLTNNPRIEYQPEDTQVSTTGDTYVPSLEVFYLGARGRYDQLFGKKTERKENKGAMTSH